MNATITKGAFGAVSTLATVIALVTLFLPYWIHIKGTDIGIFSSTQDSREYYTTGCDSTTGTLECGYLFSSKTSAVVSTIFGAVGTIIYFVKTPFVRSLPVFMAVTTTLGQAVFGIMAAVLFSYYKRNYFADDDVNIEYPTDRTVSYRYGYYLWIVSTVLANLLTLGGYLILSGKVTRKDF